MSNSGSALLDFFDAAVAAVQGDFAVTKALEFEPLDLSIPVHVIAVGKAADAMVQGAARSLPNKIRRGLMITKRAHTSDAVSALPWLQIIESSHPIPDESSLHAGAACIDFVRTVPAGHQLLVLLSGGASALMEQLIDGVTLSDAQQLNETLVAGGLPIDAINRVRKTVSTIKGGKLNVHVPKKVPVTQLIISDVPEDKLSDIGSGPLAMPEPGDFVHPGELIASLPIRLSDNLVACINAFGVSPPASSTHVWQQIYSKIIGSSKIAQESAMQAATAANYSIVQASGSLHGDVDVIADSIANTLMSEPREGVYIWGGETHLQLPDNPGRGGRNQHLALAVAKRIAGQDKLSVLCCGTDGSDGPTEDAGGIITGDTEAHGNQLGLSIDDHLHRADAGNYLSAVDALVTTGPTGTNVMDLAIALRSY